MGSNSTLGRRKQLSPVIKEKLNPDKETIKSFPKPPIVGFATQGLGGANALLCLGDSKTPHEGSHQAVTFSLNFPPSVNRVKVQARYFK